MRINVMLVLLLVICGHPAAAEEKGRWRSFFLPSEEEKNLPFFDKNSWVSTTHIAYYGPEDRDNRDIRMTLVNIGAARYPWENLGFVADAILTSTDGYIIHGEGDKKGIRQESDSLGLGGLLGLKWHFLRGKRWSTFVGVGVGGLLTDQAFPAGGTSWNLMYRLDAGLTLRLKEQWHLAASVSELHVSNGKGFVEENPSFTGRGYTLGLVYRFDKTGLFRRGSERRSGLGSHS